MPDGYYALGDKNDLSHKEPSTKVPAMYVVRKCIGGSSNKEVLRMARFCRHTWALVVNALRVYHVYAFFRDHFDDFS